MRPNLKPLAILSLVVLLVAYFPITAEGSEIVCEDSGEPAYDSLTDQNMKNTYNAIKSGVTSYQKEISISQSYNIDAEKLNIVLYAYQSDYPYYFWASYYTSYESSFGRVTKIISSEDMDANKFSQMSKQIDDVVSSISVSGGSFGDRMKSIHDAVIDRVSYKIEGKNTGNIYGVFVERECKCDGYSLAINYLCKKCDIDSMCVIGYINDEGKEDGGHAWNIICADNGSWYYLDATWDDVSDRMHRYDYFMIGKDTGTPSGKISESRTIYFQYGKTVSSAKYDYDPLFMEHMILYALIAVAVISVAAAAIVYYRRSHRAKRSLEESFEKYDSLEEEKK